MISAERFILLVLWMGHFVPGAFWPRVFCFDSILTQGHRCLILQKPKIGQRISQRVHWTINRIGRNLACMLASQRWPAGRWFAGHTGMARAQADSSSTLAMRRIGMCGYKAVPEDGHTCSFFTHCQNAEGRSVFHTVLTFWNLYL